MGLKEENIEIIECQKAEISTRIFHKNNLCNYYRYASLLRWKANCIGIVILYTKASDRLFIDGLNEQVQYININTNNYDS